MRGSDAAMEARTDPGRAALIRRVGLGAVAVGLLALALPAFDLAVLDDVPPWYAPTIGLAVCALGILLTVWAVRTTGLPFADPRALRRFTKNRGAILGAVLVGAVSLLAFVGPLAAPFDPNHIHDAGLAADGTPVGPGALADDGRPFPLGADNLGRDEYSRLLVGGRVSLSVAFIAVAIAGFLGFGAGLLGGYFRGVIDASLVGIVDLVLSLPFLLVAIALNRVIDDPSLFWLCFLLGALSWTTLARVTRSKVLQVSELEYVQAARALGATHARIIARHIVPNVLGPAIVIATTMIANIILVESAMSYLGVGVKPPIASWGSMLRDGQELLQYEPRLLLLPGALIVATVFGFNLLGEGLRDAFDPKE
ncbi:MAG: ABC transporter permease [Sandaracinaceae bacterium]